jgi:hypothetical protein
VTEGVSVCNCAFVMVLWMHVCDAGAYVCKNAHTHTLQCLSFMHTSIIQKCLSYSVFSVAHSYHMQENLAHQYYSRSCAQYSKKDWAQLKMLSIACNRD